MRFSLTEDVRIPKFSKARVFISDFLGDDEVEEYPMPGDFIIRRAYIRGTTPLYGVQASNDRNMLNWYFQGFGVDYSLFKETVQIDLGAPLIKVAGERGLNYQSDFIAVGSGIGARNIIASPNNDELTGDERDNVIEGFAGAD